ncbi:hypothetical protein [Nitratireductor luteus]|uniref:hypothetical protein n=1 Tax=Nitratireductor luteus TaxID=2976980 RepID=UPI00223FC7CE|nr:hypothetical protein [Nitratireductor luteus]
MDRITEAIAHFIGLFEVTVEEARQRDAYDKFNAQATDAPNLPGLPNSTTPFAAPFEFLGYDPGLMYRPPAPDWVLVHPWTSTEYGPLQVSHGDPSALPAHGYGSPRLDLAYNLSPFKVILPEVETLGSVANYISQAIGLSDNDYIGVGGHGLRFTPSPVGDDAVLALAGAAARQSPIMDVEMPGSAEELASFVAAASELLAGFSGDPSPGTSVFVEKSQTLEGVFANGKRVEEAPKLEDYFTPDDVLVDDDDEVHPTNARITETGIDIDASVKLESGENTLVNNAVLKNFWTAAPVTAVVGKHIELNAIIQINAWYDEDYVSSALDGWTKDPALTQAFNVAEFQRYTHDEEDGERDTPGSFPKHWVVKEVDGDLMIVNWLQQFTFMSDNDIGILSSSGVTTRVYSGDNLAYNDISIYELGFAYDLIIIGGNVYDANIIHQMNVLLDNDTIGAVNGFQTTGEGFVSTSGNLLWNQGYIHNVGGADRFETLPEHYLEAALRLTGGEDHLSDGVLSDAAFAGLGFLRVLHVKGDLHNVQYVKQTNILGDSDHVAVAMHAINENPGAEWEITTGGNALLNNAAIVDLDSLGKTYVGNGHYSNEILVQADIISTEPDLGGQNPDVLVNEAVAFLDEDVGGTGDTEYGNSGNFDADSSQADGLQTLIG